MKVGFIGLGNMGNPMAANILDAGHDLWVYDLRRGAGKNLEASGARWADSAGEAAARSHVVLSSLPGPKEVEAAVLGEEGIFAGLKKGGTYIDTSTNSPTVMRRIAGIGASLELDVLDAPVSGGVIGAQEGTLTVFVGGTRRNFESFRPLLQTIGGNVAYMGPAGSGNVTKLVNNMMMFISFLGVCEGMALGARAGIDPQMLFEVIRPSMGNSRILERTMGMLLQGKGTSSAIHLAVKDMDLGVELGREIDVPLEVGPQVKTILARFLDQGLGNEDITEIIRQFIRRSGIELG